MEPNDYISDTPYDKSGVLGACKKKGDYKPCGVPALVGECDKGCP